MLFVKPGAGIHPDTTECGWGMEVGIKSDREAVVINVGRRADVA